jgi:serine/threonine protein kinase
VAAPGSGDSLTTERWRHIEELFHAALALDGTARREYLESACGGDTELRRQVESLIYSVSAPDSAGVLTAAIGRAARNTLELPVGERIGAYEIVRKIGAGGMGAVYLASRADDQYQKNVAIKFLEGPATADVLARFRLERQILADLEHPNIARLMDGSEMSGVPYLVMEYVDGLPIDEWVRRHEPPLASLLKLFSEVCSAVSFAHRHQIVHRDIKPANILVTADGVPKLLDFGIAKMLTSEIPGGLTGATQRVMTPEYASPEQVRGDLITTLTDVYSLGLVLYEILAGRPPFQVDSTRPLDAARAICEQEPEKPSLAVARGRRRELKGDLDNIVLMAIRKEPSRRYASVDDLASDIRRFLEGRPVHARRDTVADRAGKFLRRHRMPAGVTAAALVLLAFTMLRIHAEHSRAEAGIREVREMASSLLFEFDGALRNLPGSTAARRTVVMRALEYLARLEKTTGNNPEIESELADAYSKVGYIQFDLKPPSLYEPEAARESALKEISVREGRAAGAAPRDRARLASVYFRLADLERRLGHAEAQDAARRRALSLAAALPNDLSDSNVAAALVASRLELMRSAGTAQARMRLGNEAVEFADHSSARGNAERAARLRAIYARVDVLNVVLGPDLTGDLRAQLLALRKSAESLLNAFLERAPDDVDARGWADRLDEVVCRARFVDPAESLAACRRVESNMRSVVAADPQDLSSFLSLSANYGEVGRRLVAAGKPDEAAKEFEQGLAMTETAWRLRPGDNNIRRNLILYCGDLNNLAPRLREPGAAEELRRQVTSAMALAKGR